ncbi:MAG: DNA polymerase III subunit beta [Desulfobulbaceae bacterium]|nr:DNA polymerase III subunit beta [Desulfobulbaceae bacterium]
MAMIINVSREDFLASLSSLQNVTGKKGTIAILSNVLVETKNDAITITATDLEVGIRHTIPAEILDSGAITMPAKKLFEIVRESCADIIHLESQENNWVKITAEASSYNLAGMPAEEFPAFPDYNEAALVSLSTDLVKELIDKTIFSVAPEGESQYNLAGILVEKVVKEDGQKNYMRMVSTDGHRLSMMEKENDQEIGNLNIGRTTLIPRKGIQEMRKFMEGHANIALCFEEKQAVIKSEQAIMIIRLMNGDFPDYRNILKSNVDQRFVEIERLPLLNSMRRMNLFTEDRYNAVKFHIEPNRLILSSQNMDIGNAKDELPIVYSGESLDLGFNGKYFVDVLQVLSCQTIKAFISSPETPCLIKADEDPGFVSLIMPMKL